MNPFLATITLDVRLQSRSKLYVIGIGVAIVMGLLARYFIHPDYAGRVLAVFFITGMGSTTYMMSASLVLLEKSQGTLLALRTTPLTSTAYIASKVMTLTAFALLESAIFFVVAFHDVPVNPIPLLLGVVCLGVLFTLVGLGQVATHDSVTAFLFPGAVIVTLVLELPALYVIAGPSPLWYLIPSHGSLLMMLGATEMLDAWQWGYALVVSSVAIVLAFWWAKNQFARFVGLQKG